LSNRVGGLSCGPGAAIVMANWRSVANCRSAEARARGVIVRRVEGRVQHLPVQRQADAPVVEFLQFAFHLFQTRAERRQRLRWEGHGGARHERGLVSRHHHDIGKTMVAGDDLPRNGTTWKTRGLVVRNDVEPEAQGTFLRPRRQLEVAPGLALRNPLVQPLAFLAQRMRLLTDIEGLRDHLP
jgi:hypothetical protein